MDPGPRGLGQERQAVGAELGGPWVGLDLGETSRLLIFQMRGCVPAWG